MSTACTPRDKAAPLHEENCTVGSFATYAWGRRVHAATINVGGRGGSV